MTKKLGNKIYTRPPGSARKKRNGQPWQVLLGQYLGITTQYTAVIGAGGVLGWFLDRQLGTEPFLLIAGIVIGAALGFYVLLRSLYVQQKDSHE